MCPAFNYDTISAAIHDQFSIHPNVAHDEAAGNSRKITSNASTYANPSFATTAATTATSSNAHSRTGSCYYYGRHYETEIFKALESLSLTPTTINKSSANHNPGNTNYTYSSSRNRSPTSSFTALPLLETMDQPRATLHAENAINQANVIKDDFCGSSGNDKEMIDGSADANDTLPLHHISTIHHQILQQESAEEELAVLNKL
jgi:hypothetical protein